MAAPIPHELLHQLAEGCKPSLPIKERSTWVGILRHDKDDPDEVGEEKDFLWLKCHGRITVRTLKHFYFSRFLVENLRLKHKHYYPKERNTVATLRERQEDGEHIVVLRALEPAIAKLDEEMENDVQLAQNIRGSGTMDDAFIVDDDDVVPQSAAAAALDDTTDGTVKDETASDTDAKSNASTNTSQSKHSSPAIKSISVSPPNSISRKRSYPVDEVEERVEDEASQQLWREASEVVVLQDAPTSHFSGLPAQPVRHHSTSPMHYAEASFDEVMSNSNAALNTAFKATQVYNLTLEERIKTLPEPQRSRASGSDWQTCEVPHCQKGFHMKPWTQFGPKFEALCTRDSRNLLIEDEAMEALNVMEQQLANERYEKAVKQQAGPPQDMDDDMPIVQYWHTDSQSTFGHAASSINPATLASHSDSNGLEYPRFSDTRQEMDVDSYTDMDTSYADDYLSLMDQDSLLTQVDANIGNSQIRQAVEPLPGSSYGAYYGGHQSLNGPEYQYDEDEEEVAEEDEQQSDSGSDISEQQEEEEELSDISEQEEEDEEEELVDAAAQDDDEDDGDYMEDED